MTNKLLGLDISTRTIGLCLMDDNKKLLELTHVQPKLPKPLPENKLEILFKKSDIVKEFLLKYINMNITKVIIEEPLILSNNIYTCVTLIRFNTMISRIIYDLFNVIPNYINSYNSRRFGFPELMQPRKFNKKGEKILKLNNPVLFGNYDYNCDKKMIIWEKVNNLYPEIQWIYNKNNVLAKESFDMSDSVCVVLAYINLNN
mgnify:FL=1